MKNQLDLSKMGLVEMNKAELKEISGGGWFGAILGEIVDAVNGAVISRLTGNPDLVMVGAEFGASLGGGVRLKSKI
jgi:hypothetical protein